MRQRRERRLQRPGKLEGASYDESMDAFRAELDEQLRRKAEWERDAAR